MLLTTLKKNFITIPLHPSFWCALALILGITTSSLETSYKVPLYFTVPALLLILLLFAFTRSLRKSLILLIIASFFIGGFYRYASYRYYYQRTQASILNRSLTGTAQIQECTTNKFQTYLTLTITELTDRDLYASATVRLYISQKLSLKPDDTISFKNLTLKKQKNEKFAWYLCKEDIIACAYVKKLNYKLINRPSWTIKRYCATKRASIATSVASSLSERAYTLFATIFLGKKEKSYCYYELRTTCVHWGIVHYLARSGLHVVVLIGIWMVLLRLLGLPFIAHRLLIMILLALYYLLSWPSISFVRAVLVFLMYQGCTISGRSFNSLHLLTLTTIIILIVNPLQVFFLDFQLSFGLTCTLGLYREISYQIRIAEDKTV